jgi:hypothetical protein
VETLIALAQIGGFAFAAGVLLFVLAKAFNAWRNGELIAKPVWERAETRSDTLATQLERNTDALVDQTATLKRLADAQEAQATAAVAQAKALERLARQRRPS